MSPPHLRIARPVSDPDRMARLYCAGFGMSVVGSFRDHAGFDGVMVGAVGAYFHFEFTHCHDHPVKPSPTVEDLAVFYYPDESGWEASFASLHAAGFRQVESFNPYWEANGATFEDPDGYRIVLARGGWENRAKAYP
jgi:catechol 2,3-dioxygenase-like lactoylglutathione lyase family enzyme